MNVSMLVSVFMWVRMRTRVRVWGGGGGGLSSVLVSELGLSTIGLLIKNVSPACAPSRERSSSVVPRLVVPSTGVWSVILTPRLILLCLRPYSRLTLTALRIRILHKDARCRSTAVGAGVAVFGVNGVIYVHGKISVPHHRRGGLAKVHQTENKIKQSKSTKIFMNQSVNQFEMSGNFNKQ